MVSLNVIALFWCYEAEKQDFLFLGSFFFKWFLKQFLLLEAEDRLHFPLGGTCINVAVAGLWYLLGLIESTFCS